MINERFKEIIDSFDADYRVIAESIGTSHGVLRKIINGNLDIPGDIVEALVKIVPINLEYLFTGNGNPFTDDQFDPKKFFNSDERKYGKISKISKGISPEVCDRVRMIRKDQDLTQKDFADEVQCERHIQAAIENYRQNPTVQYMQLLWNRYAVNLNYLITGIGARYVGESNQFDMDEFNNIKSELRQAKVMISVLMDKIESN